MKFSAKTLQILRNFSTINQSVVFKPGTVITTLSPTKSVMARATVDTQFESSFAIWDLPNLLGALTLFEDPELSSNSKILEIQEGGRRMNYVLADPSLVVEPPGKDVELPSPEVQFTLTNDEFSRIMKALAVIGAPQLAVTGDGETMYFETHNEKNPSESTYRVEVGKTQSKFKLIFLAENIKMMPGDYEVRISSKGLSHFKGTDIEYWIAIEHTSTFEG